MDKRIKAYVQNISLLRISAEDAKSDARQWAARSDGDDCVDTEYGIGEEEAGEDNETSADKLQTYRALCNMVSKLAQSDTQVSGNAQLQDWSRGIQDALAEADDEGFTNRGPEFYHLLQAQQQSPLHPFGLFSRPEVGAIWKTEKRLDKVIISNIAGSTQRDTPDSETAGEGLPTPPSTQTTRTPVGPGGSMQLEVGPYTTWTQVAWDVGLVWTLNKLQQLALFLPTEALDTYQHAADGQKPESHMQYIGGEGGTGKSRVIEALKDVFRAKGQLHRLIITASSGSAAARIGGMTIHSACGLQTDDYGKATRSAFNPSEETKWRWDQKLAIVLDEVSMVGGATLHDIDEHLQRLREDKRPFGGIPIVIFSGDFFQFSPVAQTSLLIGIVDMAWNSENRGKVDSVQRHQRGHRLFKKFDKVVILQEQVRAGGCDTLKSFLHRLRKGEQTEEDFTALQQRFVQDKNLTFADGLRAITPLNRNRWETNMAAAVEWGRARHQHISIFVSNHVWENNRVSDEEVTQTLSYGDDSKIHIPGVFIYTQGMPVVVTKNTLSGLGVVNGAEFNAIDVIPDPAFPGYFLSDDTTIHFGPPSGLLLASDDTKHFAIPGIPAGTVLLKPDPATSMKRTASNFTFLSEKCRRTGLPCTPAFVVTDYKSQGRSFTDLLLELRGKFTTTTGPSKCDFMSLYVQLSRATRWEGIRLYNELRRVDFIEPINQVDPRLRKGMEGLERLGKTTRQLIENTSVSGGQGATWIRRWKAMTESRGQAATDV